MVQELPHAAPSAPSSLPDIITSSKPPVSGLRLPVVNRSNSPPASFHKRLSSTQEVRRSPSPPDKRQIDNSRNQSIEKKSVEDTNPNVETDKTNVSRRPSHESMSRDDTLISGPSQSSSNSKDTAIGRRKGNNKLPAVLNDKESSLELKQGKGNQNGIDNKKDQKVDQVGSNFFCS